MTKRNDIPTKTPNKGRTETDVYLEVLRESAVTAAALIAVCAAVTLTFFFYIWGK